MVVFLRHSLNRIAWAFLVLGLLPLAATAEGRRVALVVGNAGYHALPVLETPTLDAQAINAALSGLGFTNTLLIDPDTESFQAALAKTATGLDQTDTVMFFYSGYGFQNYGADLLIPVGAALNDTAALDGETWRLDQIADVLASHGSKVLLFVDAAHQDIVADALRAGGASTGLAQLGARANTFTVFAAAPGSIGLDKVAGSSFSPFATALLANIASKGMSLSDLMIKVRNDVAVATGSQQIPWEQSSLRDQFYFAPADSLAMDAAPAFEFDSAELTLISAPPASGRALYGLTARLPADLPSAVQDELRRLGCYNSGVDGSWGAGSQAAMGSYYQAKGLPQGDAQPTEPVYRTLLTEPDKVCLAPASAPKSSNKAPTPKSGTAKASTTTTAKKPAAAAKTAPATKPGVKCKFLLIALVCQ